MLWFNFNSYEIYNLNFVAENSKLLTSLNNKSTEFKAVNELNSGK